MTGRQVQTQDWRAAGGGLSFLVVLLGLPLCGVAAEPDETPALPGAQGRLPATRPVELEPAKNEPAKIEPAKNEPDRATAGRQDQDKVDSGSVATLLRMVASRDRSERSKAVARLRKVRSKDKAVHDALRAEMKPLGPSENGAPSCVAAVALWRNTGESEESLPYLKSALYDDQNWAAGEAVRALLEMDLDSLLAAKGPLRSAALYHHNIAIRRNATRALNSLKDAKPDEPMLSNTSSGVEGSWFVLRGNGVPPHAIGAFPNDHCPHALRLQTYLFRSPHQPTVADAPIKLDNNFLFGITESGIPFDSWIDRFWRDDRSSGWRYNVLRSERAFGLDEQSGYVHAAGDYRYHGAPAGARRFNPQGRFGGMVLIGYAADGHFVFNGVGHDKPKDASSKVRKLRSSYQLKKGNRPPPPHGPGGAYDGTFVEDYEYVAGSGDLDECNGRVGVHSRFGDRVTYNYHITDTFPCIPLYFHSRPDPSFRRPAE